MLRQEGSGLTPFSLTLAEPAAAGRVTLPGREEFGRDTTTVSVTAPNGSEDTASDDD